MAALLYLVGGKSQALKVSARLQELLQVEFGVILNEDLTHGKGDSPALSLSGPSIKLHVMDHLSELYVVLATHDVIIPSGERKSRERVLK